jgi:hypothetical protein
LTVYLVTWDQIKPELGYSNPGSDQECDRM